MPSRLMNSWAKVMSRDALARSFRASSLASMLDDWMRSCSWEALSDWVGVAGRTRGEQHVMFLMVMFGVLYVKSLGS
jgi:hypothetical protein